MSEKCVYQPDILYIANERLSINKCQYVDGSPDFIIEILSIGTWARDTQDKFFDYEKYGVKEYWLLNPSNLFASQFYFLEENCYKAFCPQNNIISSKIIPGFTINLNALQKKVI